MVLLCLCLVMAGCTAHAPRCEGAWQPINTTPPPPQPEDAAHGR